MLETVLINVTLNVSLTYVLVHKCKAWRKNSLAAAHTPTKDMYLKHPLLSHPVGSLNA